jgi:hypothetical protein
MQRKQMMQKNKSDGTKFLLQLLNQCWNGENIINLAAEYTRVKRHRQASDDGGIF